MSSQAEQMHYASIEDRNLYHDYNDLSQADYGKSANLAANLPNHSLVQYHNHVGIARQQLPSPSNPSTLPNFTDIWVCECGAEDIDWCQHCPLCGRSKPSTDANTAPSYAHRSLGAGSPAPGVWECPTCGLPNSVVFNDYCANCGTPKPA